MSHPSELSAADKRFRKCVKDVVPSLFKSYNTLDPNPLIGTPFGNALQDVFAAWSSKKRNWALVQKTLCVLASVNTLSIWDIDADMACDMEDLDWESYLVNNPLRAEGLGLASNYNKVYKNIMKCYFDGRLDCYTHVTVDQMHEFIKELPKECPHCHSDKWMKGGCMIDDYSIPCGRCQHDVASLQKLLYVVPAHLATKAAAANTN